MGLFRTLLRYPLSAFLYNFAFPPQVVSRGHWPGPALLCGPAKHLQTRASGTTGLFERIKAFSPTFDWNGRPLLRRFFPFLPFRKPLLLAQPRRGMDWNHRAGTFTPLVLEILLHLWGGPTPDGLVGRPLVQAGVPTCFQPLAPTRFGFTPHLGHRLLGRAAMVFQILFAGGSGLAGLQLLASSSGTALPPGASGCLGGFVFAWEPGVALTGPGENRLKEVGRWVWGFRWVWVLLFLRPGRW
jgi:hypothetical protein